MQALLGRIVEISSDEARHKITIEPLCTLPDRKAPPAWLKDQKLTFERAVFREKHEPEENKLQAFVSDPREIGEIGDSIALTVGESSKFLQPLVVTPERISLLWWKDETPPNWEVKSNGKKHRGQWTPNESKTHWSAEFQKPDSGVLESSVLEHAFNIEASCGELKAHHAVSFPAYNSTPGAHKFETTNGVLFDLRNRYLSAGITPRSGGGVQALTQLGEPKNRFASPSGLIQHPLNWGGHVDAFRTGWGEWNTMRDVKLDVAGTTREAGTSRVTMEGEIEDGLRTQFSATLLDEWPLLLMRRDFFLHEKKDEKKDEKSDALKQPVDAMRLFQTGFRSALSLDVKGSRIWCRENGQTIAFSLPRENQHQTLWHWTMDEGWALFQQSRCHAHLLYFFDPQNAPHLGLWRGPHVAALQPFWPGVPLKPGDSTGFSLGLASGDVGGANEHGAWIACRALQGDELHCAFLARLHTPGSCIVYASDTEEKRAPLMPLYLSGLGTVHGAHIKIEKPGDGATFNARLEKSGDES